MDQPDDPSPIDPRSLRRPWTEGPDEDAKEESWLGLADDELLHRITTLGLETGVDERLLEIIQSERHFFIRQEAAKKVRDHRVLFDFEDDRHIGQILVRHLTRREDVTYLERLVARSRHVEVRAAAQVQLAQLWGRLGGPTSSTPEGESAPPPPEFEGATDPPAPPEEAEIEIDLDSETDWGEVPLEEADESPGVVEAEPTTPPSPLGTDEGVDGSLLGWAIHFLVEQAWPHVDTRRARGLLTRTHAELLPVQPALSFFRVEDDARVHVDLRGGARLPREAVPAVAVWLAAFLEATRATVPDLGEIDVRQSTRLMEDALEEAGFYEAFRAAAEN